MSITTADVPPPKFDSHHYVSLGEFAYSQLRESIQTGKLRPGSRVREKEVADWLQISRTPVREALRRLEVDGLPPFQPHRVMVIAQLEHQAVMELYSMREVLEGTSAALAAQHATDAEIAAIRDMLDLEVTLGEDPERIAQHNRQVHYAIHRAAHNRYLIKALRALRDSMALLNTTFQIPGRSEIARGEHQQIIAAIAGRDARPADEPARAQLRLRPHTRPQPLLPATPTTTPTPQDPHA